MKGKYKPERVYEKDEDEAKYQKSLGKKIHKSLGMEMEWDASHRVYEEAKKRSNDKKRIKEIEGGGKFNKENLAELRKLKKEYKN